MRALYEDIRERLENEITGLHVRLWNNQIELSNSGEQIPFGLPAVFIDFPTIEWVDLGKGTQQGNLIIRFYVCYESFHTAENEEDLDLFTLRQQVYLALQGFIATGAGALQRVSEQTDPRHTNIYVWVMDYSTSYQDKVAEFPRGLTTAEIETLTLSTDLIIDAGTVDGIRTDSEFTE